MTDITADEYRTAAKVDRHHGGQSAAQFYEDNARVIEATEADSLTTQLAKAMFESNAGLGWSGVSESVREIYIRAANTVLAHLHTAGRLIPAGGMALTAEQVEDVRLLLGLNGSQDITVVLDAQARLRALFPATEPADPVVPNPEHPYFVWEQGYQAAVTDSDAGVDGTRGNAYTSNPYSLGESEPDPATEPAEAAKFELPEGRPWDKTAAAEPFSERLKQHGWDELRRRGHKVAEPAKECTTDGDCGAAQHLDFCYNAPTPTPAVPAEEETKADTTAIKRDAWFKGYDACRQGDQRHNPHPTSSPVVPAPTETGPWQHRDGRICVYAPAVTPRLRYRIGEFNDHGDFVHDDSERQLPEGFAPFVAAKEG